MMIVRPRHLMKNGTQLTSILYDLRARGTRSDLVTGISLFPGEMWVREVSVEAMTIQMLRIANRDDIEQVATEGRASDARRWDGHGTNIEASGGEWDSCDEDDDQGFGNDILPLDLKY
jgi:hypothetical protein